MEGYADHGCNICEALEACFCEPESLFLVVIERVTRENDSGNGETVFFVYDYCGEEILNVIRDIPTAMVALMLAQRRAALYDNCPIVKPEAI